VLKSEVHTVAYIHIWNTLWNATNEFSEIAKKLWLH